MVTEAQDRLHPSHVTRISAHANGFDEICVNCGSTDRFDTWGELALPCPNEPTARRVARLLGAQQGFFGSIRDH